MTNRVITRERGVIPGCRAAGSNQGMAVDSMGRHWSRSPSDIDAYLTKLRAETRHPSTKLLYIQALTACVNVSIDREKHSKERGWNGGLSQTTERFESNLTAVDPVTGEVKKSVQLRYPNYSSTLATAGGLIFLGLLDGTAAAFDDTTLDELWKPALLVAT